MASEGLVLVLGWPVQRMCGVGWFVAPPFPHGVGAPSPLRGGDCGGGSPSAFWGDLFGACMALVCSRAV